MKNKFKLLIPVFLIVVVICILFIYRFFSGNGVAPKGGKAVILVPDGSSYEQVIDSVRLHLAIKDERILNWVARKKSYPSLIKPGRYVVEKEMSYLKFINMLRAGNQVPVNLTFNNIRTVYQVAGKAGKLIEADSAKIAAFLSDPENYRNDGFTRENVISVFIPDTYNIFWNTNADRFYSRMLKEYRKFWNEDRVAKAMEVNLSPVEVATLASIVDDEVVKSDEKPKIAGVYLNRLRAGMPLQADPTIKFALNDFSIARILTKHLQVNSPYNTYKYRGLPPGPIGCPTKEGIEAVLNAEKHEYYFFVAKADFSGYHNFSRTLAEHNRYAAEYQKELDRRKIFK
jgi:UPF0755 protein